VPALFAGRAKRAKSKLIIHSRRDNLFSRSPREIAPLPIIIAAPATCRARAFTMWRMPRGAANGTRAVNSLTFCRSLAAGVTKHIPRGGIGPAPPSARGFASNGCAIPLSFPGALEISRFPSLLRSPRASAEPAGEGAR